MRFNPKARLDTSRVGDGGGGGGGWRRPDAHPAARRHQAGGGIGGLIIIILFVVLTQCMGGGGGLPSPDAAAASAGTDTSRMDDRSATPTARPGADANEDEDCARVGGRELARRLLGHDAARAGRHGVRSPRR